MVHTIVGVVLGLLIGYRQIRLKAKWWDIGLILALYVWGVYLGHRWV